jgi:hypothetical protein
VTSRQTNKASRPAFTWLANLLGESPRTQWVDESGATWNLTAYWAVVDGRATLAGLDIHSFIDRPSGGGGSQRTAINDRPVELTQRVLRGIPISRVRETTREQAAAEALRMAAFFGRPAQPGTVKIPGMDATAAHYADRGCTRRPWLAATRRPRSMSRTGSDRRACQ